jgi:signal transduction histidine kinase
LQSFLNRKKHFNLKNCVENVLKIFNTEFKNKNIEIVLNLKIYIKADEKMIERVLVNLITNSILALENLQTQKKISIELQEFNNRIFIIKVEDNGGGIDEKIADKIFLPFFTTRQNGSGIGLTLAKSIMEAHNGYPYRKTENGSSFEGWLI